MRFLVATSNPGKVREYEALALALGAGGEIRLEPLPGMASLPKFEESAETFAENAAGKALHYCRFVAEPVLADDSGLCVDALGGAPGVQSARYAGPNADDAARIAKLLAALQGSGARRPEERAAHFVCVMAAAQQGRALLVVSARADGVILDSPRGSGGFGYDPVFLFPPLGRTFAELTRVEKNGYSHRGKAFARFVEFVRNTVVP